MSIAEKLRKLLDIKAAIKEALFYVGQEVADKMEDWAMAIRNICNIPFENLGYTAEQAKHCRWLIKKAYARGIAEKELAEGVSNIYPQSSIPFIVPNTKLITGRVGSLTSNSNFAFLCTESLFATELNNVSNRYANFIYIDIKIPNCIKLLGFQDNQILVYVKVDVSNILDISNFLVTSTIGSSNNLRVVKIRGLGTQPESSEWNGLKHKKLVGIPLDDPEENLTTNARQDLLDSLITNSFDRATAGYSVFTITLSQATFNLLTEEEITAITNKGYTITV
jgi:hypothetical protein